MKRSAILGIIAALSALAGVMVMSVGVYAIAADGSIDITDSVSAPGSLFSHVTSGGAEGVATTSMDGGSSGMANTNLTSTASGGGEAHTWGTAEIYWSASGVVTATSDATASEASIAESNAFCEIYSDSSGDVTGTASSNADGYASYADTQSIGVISDGGYGAANAVSNASATNGGTAQAYTISEIAGSFNGSANSLADATAANGGLAQANAVAYIGSGADENFSAYSYAVSTGSAAYASTVLTTGSGTPVPGFYWGAYASGNSFALAFLFIPSPDNMTGFTFVSAGNTDASASIEVHGAGITVYTGLPF